ncbi:MAG TPA: hypothetical protein VNP95_00405, partial [Thermomicrobiales bacterium]|nr:hypothetical protein [Thermomicrobiales bacterium]
LVARQFIACGDGGTPVSDLAPQVFSQDFLTRHPGYLSGNSTLTEDDVARAEAISTAVVAAKPTLTVMGLPGADDQSSRTDGFYEVFLPQQNTIQLDDGRFAIPLTIAFTDEARATAAATEIASSTGTPITVAVVVFTLQDGSPRIDDLLLGCIAHCDGFWAQQRAMTGTPQTNVDLATPAIRPTATIDPSAILPIPASECVVPTIAMGNEALPERQYAPPLKPTDANATAVTSDSRAFIACAEATPSTDNVQDVIAPFETERLRNEMDANPDQPPTTEQIEAGKRISAYLEEQGVTSFAERAPADAVDPSQTVTPRSVGGWTITPPGFYTVPMPGVAIQFPDGRIGIPTLMMVTTDDLWADLQNRAYTSGSLGIFARVGDTWLLDETLGLCIGECDTFWQDAATPSGDSQWLQPVNASECQPVSASTYREYVRPRDYTIVNVPASDGIGVARQGRTWAACSSNGFLGNSTIDRQFETQRFADAGGTTQPLTDEQITRARELSEHYQDAGYQVFQRTPEGMNLAGNPAAKQASLSDQEFTYTYVFEPDEAIGLSDGRVAIPVTILFADDGTSTTVENQPTQATLLAVWAYVGETWLLDETLPICLGDCAGFWANPPATDFPTSSPLMNIWFQVFTVNPNAPISTPVASASPADDDLAFWLSMPGVDDCVLPDGGPFTSNRTREYLPWTAPGDTTARQVALADRNRVACDQRSGLVPGSSLYTSRYIGPAVPGSAVDAETLTRMQALSAAIPEQDPAVWVRQGRTGAAGLTGDAAQRYAVLPENVYRLPDGRYAAIPVTIATDAATVLTNGAVTLPVAIYTQSGDAWLLDEQVAVCLGDCQAYWSSFHVIDAPPGTPGTPATPAGLAIVPIDRRTLAVA